MNKVLKNKKIIIAVIVIIALGALVFFFLSKEDNKEQSKLFEIRVDESTLWKASVEYSPDYSTTAHLEKDSFLRLLSSQKNVYYYSTNNAVATVGFDGTVNVNGVGECTIYGVTEKESDGLSNYIKVVVE